MNNRAKLNKDLETKIISLVDSLELKEESVSRKYNELDELTLAKSKLEDDKKILNDELQKKCNVIEALEIKGKANEKDLLIKMNEIQRNIEEIQNKDITVREKDDEILRMTKKIEDLEEEIKQAKQDSENEIGELNENKNKLNDNLKAKQKQITLLTAQKDQQNADIQKLKQG